MSAAASGAPPAGAEPPAAPQAMSFSAVNGLGLALVIPAAQSLVADYYEERSRGGAFGLLFGVSSLGAPLCAQDEEQAHVEQ